jgi:hypothetical protein
VASLAVPQWRPRGPRQAIQDHGEPPPQARSPCHARSGLPVPNPPFSTLRRVCAIRLWPHLVHPLTGQKLGLRANTGAACDRPDPPHHREVFTKGVYLPAIVPDKVCPLPDTADPFRSNRPLKPIEARAFNARRISYRQRPCSGG